MMDVLRDDGFAMGILEPARKGGVTTALMYRSDDPLMVDLILWEHRSGLGMFRSVLRSDLRAVAEGGSFLCGDLSMARPTPRFLRVVVEHDLGAIVAVHPAAPLLAFLDATAALVPPTEQAETEKVDALVAQLQTSVQP